MNWNVMRRSEKSCAQKEKRWNGVEKKTRFHRTIDIREWSAQKFGGAVWA